MTFEKLSIGGKYDRPFLAKLWGYKGWHAIARGVVTPAGDNVVVLFVTEEKQESLTQYVDQLVGDQLHWEGEESHASDGRIAMSRDSDDEIHLFYRDRHHAPFTYFGPISLVSFEARDPEPSRFIFDTSGSAGG